MNRSQVIRCLVAVLASLCAAGVPAQANQHAFTVADDIRMAAFGDYPAQPVTWSPQRRYVAVYVERGLLGPDKVQGELRIYAADALKAFVNGPQTLVAPPPLWSIKLQPYKTGPVIENIRWAPDAASLSFMAVTAHGHYALMFVDIARRSVRRLSLPGQDITAADVRDATHYVYASRDPAIQQPRGDGGIATALTGHPLEETLFPIEKYPLEGLFYMRSELWAAHGGKPFRVNRPHDGAPVHIFFEGQQDLSLSPDGSWLLTALPVASVPTAWADWTVTVPAYRLRAGAQDTSAFSESVQLVSRYALINLESGRIVQPSPYPSAMAMGWYVDTYPAWSADSREVLLPAQFFPADRGALRGALPCVAVTRVESGDARCLERFRATRDPSGIYRMTEPVDDLHFGGAQGHDAFIGFQHQGDTAPSHGTRRYTRAGDDAWTLADSRAGSDTGDMQLQVRQSYKDPPVLVALDPASGKSRAVWDPNPQLRDVRLNPVEVLHWKSTDGRDEVGGLYKPAAPPYLVIPHYTHGNDTSVGDY